MDDRVVIGRRFRGPPDSANGGYSCGVLARFLDAPAAEVTLRSPPPLERPLDVERGGESVRMVDGGTLIAEGRRVGGVELEPPAPAPAGDAAAASRRSPLFERHPFPTCFVCGPARDPGDGLRIIPGALRGSDVVADTWTPDESVSTDEGTVEPEIVWAALDCPSGNALLLLPEVGTVVLARLAVELGRPVRLGETLVATGWALHRDGRKLHSGSALFAEHGELVGLGRALWIELRDQGPAASSD